MSSADRPPQRWRVIPGGKSPLQHAPILIGAILLAALIGLAAVLVPGSDTEATTPDARSNEVEAALHDALGGAADGIEATVEGGRVRLRGVVESPELRDEALRVVHQHDPAVRVEDELHVLGTSRESE
jgi:osmotically-inducible protein OsmY